MSDREPVMVPLEEEFGFCVTAICRYLSLTLLPSNGSLPLRLEVLDAEDRLSIACEKGFSEDPVTLQLRKAFQVTRG